jgi:hypothetical protein
MSARPLNLYDALRMTVAETGEIQAKPGGHVESERRSPKVFATTGTSFSLDLHVWGVAAEALSADSGSSGVRVAQQGSFAQGPQSGRDGISTSAPPGNGPM